MDSSSSMTPPPFPFKYHVFLSFSGEDTRYGFTSHLYEALHDKHIEVYVDQRGEEISSDLCQVIHESSISVVIFSKNYAASRWRLEELVKIMECKQTCRQIVIPVFYDIEPADVSRQNSTFADAFKKYEERCGYSRVQRWRDALIFAAFFKKHDEERWRDALHEAASITGFDLRDFKSESELKQAIVKEILNQLNVMSQGPPENTHPVDIREEDSGHEDEVAIQVPKITVERMFVAFNLILEIPSAVFDQLSSVHKPQYVLLIMLMSLTTMLICIIELVYKGTEARVGWRWRKKIPWFYYPSGPSDKPFGTVTDFIGLLCSIFQCISSVSDYVFYLRNINVPIKISIWPLVFAFCLLCSIFSKKSPKKYALL